MRSSSSEWLNNPSLTLTQKVIDPTTSKNQSTEPVPELGLEQTPMLNLSSMTQTTMLHFNHIISS